MGILDTPALSPQKAAKLYAPKTASLRGSNKVRAMADAPPYAAPVMAVPAVVTESTTRLPANTKDIGYNDPAFRWPCFVDLTAGGANPRGNTKIDGTGRKPSVPYSNVSFDYDGRTFDILYKPSATFAYRIWVDEKAHAAAMVPVVTTGASQAYLQVDLGSASIGRPRRIVVEFSCDSPIVFYGLKVQPDSLALPPSTQSPRVMIVGDSYTNGLGALNRGYAYGVALGRMMGWADTWCTQLGVPSTGLINTVGTTDGNYLSRLAPDVIPYNPDLLIIQGSINDRPYAGLGTLAPALRTYVNTFRQSYPNVPVVVTSPLYSGAPIAADLTIRDELKAEALSLGCPFIDLFSPGTFTGNGMWGYRRVTDGVTTAGSATITSATAAFTAGDVGMVVRGAGIPDRTKISSVTNGTTAVLNANATATATGLTLDVTKQRADGNADWYSGGDTGTDGTHPSKEGHFYLAWVLALRLRAALGLAE